MMLFAVDAAAQTSSAEGIVWDLSDLYRGPDDPQIGTDLEIALARAEKFEKDYRGQINVAGGPKPELLKRALDELESLSELMDKPAVYAHLLHAAKTDEPKHGALLARTQERRTAINKHLIFFELEWVRVDEDAAQKLLANPQLSKYQHFLQQKRLWRPHYLTEPEEKILDEKAITGRVAFVRLFDETTSSLRCRFEHNGRCEELTLPQILSRLYDADREVRRQAAAGLTRALKEHSRLLTFIFNTLVLDHKSTCDLRHFSDPMMPRHLSNEITPQIVEALMAAVETYHPTVQRYYRLKAKLLGVEKLYDFDRYAPLFDDLPACPWQEAKKIVQESYDAFSQDAGKIIREFFDKKWIDAELRPGKRGGAFSASAVPSVHPYILMNYTDKLRDVMTLAHELGHGLHQYLSRQVGYLQCDTPLTTAETASVFGEMLTFRKLLELYPQPRTRLALLCSKIEDAFATVARQVALTRFEQKLHRARREQGELTAEQINDLWLEANRPMHGDAVDLTEGYRWWWLYIGHFVHVPFYCYAYAFGELLVLALVRKYEQEGDAFVPKYLELLAAGGSRTPDELLAKIGIDISEPAFWELGLGLLDDMVKEAEDLADKL